MIDSRPFRHFWLLTGLVLGLLLLGLVVVKTDMRGTWQALAETEPAWAAVVVVCSILFMALKSLRWRLILRPVLHASFSFVHKVVYVGTATNLVVAHSGELLRAALLARRGGVGSSSTLATIAVERFLDFVALLVMASIACLIDERIPAILATAGLIGIVITLSALLVLVVVLNPVPQTQVVFRAIVDHLPPAKRTWLTGHVKNARAGLAVLKSPLDLLVLLLLSLLQWSAVVAAIWASAQAVGVTINLGAAIAVFVLTVIGLTLPSAPVQFGTLQLAFIVGMQLVDSDATRALAASIVYTCFVNFMMMLIGMACWLSMLWRPTASSIDTPRS